jgi:hypothetical protein
MGQTPQLEISKSQLLQVLYNLLAWLYVLHFCEGFPLIWLMVVNSSKWKHQHDIVQHGHS